MSEAAALQAQTAKAPPSNPHSLLVQRKCACGGSSGLTGSCTECERKKLLGQPLQTKLRISEPGDEYEQEADRVAEQVMRMAEPENDNDHSKAATAPLVQRRVNASSGGIGAAQPIVHDVLALPGQPLDAATRTFFEPRFGYDFSNVRIHADARAAQSADQMNAHAYTVEQSLVFNVGRYRPQGIEGQRLLAHELAHVVQQSAMSSSSLQRFVDEDQDTNTAETVEPVVSENAESVAKDEAQNGESIVDLMSLDPIRVHFSDRDIERIVEAGQFRDFIVAHDLVEGWVEYPNEAWYVYGEETSGRSLRHRTIVHAPRKAEQFYDALSTHDATAERVISAVDVDFSRLAPEGLTESELFSLFTTGRFSAFVDYHGLTYNFSHGQTGELVEPENLDEFHEMRVRDRDATPDEVIGRFKGVLLGYLEPTLLFYNQHLTFHPRGLSLPQAVLDLFALYLQTRSLANVSQALSVYFGVHEAEAASGANSVTSAISGLIKRARAPLTSDQVLTSQGTRRATISSILNSLPETGQSVSSERTFEALDEIWGAIAATLLSDSGFSLNLYLSLPLNLVNQVFRRRDAVAALVERVQGIQTVGEIYGLVHRFKESAIDREYLYKIIGIPESFVDQAAVAPAPIRQVCEECHEDPFDRAHPRPPGLDATEAQWRLALELAQARDAQAAWDTAVQVLVIGGSIGAALLAGALTGGLGWVATATAAAGAAGLAAAGTSSYEIYQAGVTEEIASGAHAASNLYPEFGLGSEGFLVWAERNLEHTITGTSGNILVAIATAPIPGAGSTLIKKVLASMLMGGLDGLCSWIVDPRVNQADFLIETHVLAGGKSETAPTPGQTLVMSIGAGALFGGLFEGGLKGAERLYFHVDMGSGHTKVSLENGTDVTAQVGSLNQQLREGEPKERAGSEFVDQILARSKQLERKPLLADQSRKSGREMMEVESDVGSRQAPGVSRPVKGLSKKFTFFGYPHHLTVVERNGELVLWLCSPDCDALIRKIEDAIAITDPNSRMARDLSELLVDAKYLDRSWNFLTTEQAQRGLDDITSRLEKLGRKPALVGMETQGVLAPLLQGRNLPQGPSENAVLKARVALQQNAATKVDFEILLAESVKVSRKYLLAQSVANQGPLSLTSTVLAGKCGMGRDCSAIYLAAIASQSASPIQISRFHTWTLFSDFFQRALKPVGNHAFAVVTFPDGSQYLLDPTFAQFESVVSKIGVREFSVKLIENGFLPLDGNTAALYANALWRASPYESPLSNELAQEVANRLLSGKHAVMTEMVGAGQPGLAYSLPARGDFPDILSTEDVVKWAKAYRNTLIAAGDPGGLAEPLEQLARRLERSAE